MIQQSIIQAGAPLRRVRNACAVLVAATLSSCGGGTPPPEAAAPMPQQLKKIADRVDADNSYLATTPLNDARRDVAKSATAEPGKRISVALDAGFQELRAGEVLAAVDRCKEAASLLGSLPKDKAQACAPSVLLSLAVSQLRRGELENCCARHTPDSCVMPIRGGGIHTKEEGSREAIETFKKVLQCTKPESDDWWSARWLMNLSYMTVGEWPQGVPAEHVLKPSALGTPMGFPRFENIATRCGLAGMNLAGGVATEDYDGDGLYDIAMSNWDSRRAIRLYHNNGDGTFTDIAEKAGLSEFLGGLSLQSIDYDEDGDPDLFVTRGAWLNDKGLQPCSLLRNDGGVFTEMAPELGLSGPGLDFPTQNAGWADYDGDGDLDVFVGAEAQPLAGLNYKSKLFRNDNGKFVNVAAQAGVENLRWAKGCSWGDYDHDGDPDLYVSNLIADNRLYRNNADGTFTDVAAAVGVTKPWDGFPCWFFDANGDGNLDLLAHAFFRNIAPVAAAYWGKPKPEHVCRLYLGDGKGGMTDVSDAWGLGARNSPTMGANFGDLNNDGRQDFYEGTGSPNYDSLCPNVMFLNVDGKRFHDVTVEGGFGVLQKGHAISFADLDGDGDQEVVASVGGAYTNDTFHNSLHENPGFGNHWIRVKLTGSVANRPGVGARIQAVIEENGVERSVYVFPGCVASFGSNPTMAHHMGVGKAAKIKKLEVRWPRPSTKVQTFTDLEVDKFYEVKEAEAAISTIPVKRIQLQREG